MRYFLILFLSLLLAACAAPRSSTQFNYQAVELAEESLGYTESTGSAAPPAVHGPKRMRRVVTLRPRETQGEPMLSTVSPVEYANANTRPVRVTEQAAPEVRLPTTDDVLAQLNTATLALTAPESRNISEDVPVKLLVSLDQSQQELIEELNAEADAYIVSGNVNVTKTMTATISAPDFEITSVTPNRQAITTGVTEWLWNLRPKTHGKHHVTVTLVAHVMVDGERVEKHIKTFDRELIIEITTQQKLADFFSKYWQWLFSTLLLPLGVFGWKFITKRKEKSKE